MGLVSKLKNILFEEEEVEIPVIEKKEKKPEVVREYKEVPRKEEVKVTNYQNYDSLGPVIHEEKKMEEKARVSTPSNNDVVSEREIFKSEKTFNFPAFDEEEFDSYVPRKRPTNILERERKQEKKTEYKTDYRKDYKRVEKTEEVKEVKKFKPSPIISPVYGILDKNYTPDEITTRTEVTPSRSLDVDSVRKKAFGPKEESLEKIDLKDEEILVDQTLEEKLEKARTIDELLRDSSDDVIDIASTEDESLSFEPFSEDHSFDVEELPKKEEVKKTEDVEDDTLENDLFDLIDSMYENGEEDK